MVIMGITGHRTIASSRNSLESKVLEILRDEQVSEVHTGMAIGFDLIVAHLCYTHNIPYIAHIPFEGQERKWSNAWQKLYRTLRTQAKAEIIYNDTYNKEIYFRRDEGIVDVCDKLIAYYDGRTKGGTYHTVKYAMKKQRFIFYVL